MEGKQVVHLSPDSDQDFDPSAEMLVDEYDDEKTLDEEEALESDASDDELNTLQKEGEMPLEDLLAMFGYKDGEKMGSEPESEEEEDESDEEEEEEEGGGGGGEVSKEAAQCSSALKATAPDKPSSSSATKEATATAAVPAATPVPRQAPVAPVAPVPVQQPLAEVKATPTKTPSPVTRATPTPPHPPSRREHRTTSTAHLLRSVSHASESSNSDSDEDFTLEEYWKKNENFSDVNILGPAYARVPHQVSCVVLGLCKYDDAPAYENEDRLLWDPAKLSDSDVEDYLCTAQEMLNNSSTGINSFPLGSHTRDDEQALYLLLQCGHNIEEALRRRRMNPTMTTEMSLWSEEECRSFESGLRLYGKDFHLIQLHKVRTRSVGELVHFYYLWKKTERHDMFASKIRLEKKKYALHPGTTDYMDRFLDEQENSQQQLTPLQPRDRSTSPSEPKRPRLALPLQLTSQLASHHENGRESSGGAAATGASDLTTRENGRDRLWAAPGSSSDEDDLPLIATTVRPTLGKVAATTVVAQPSSGVVQNLCPLLISARRPFLLITCCTTQSGTGESHSQTGTKAPPPERRGKSCRVLCATGRRLATPPLRLLPHFT
ncbi:hypothetical protein HPB48_010916 [Haemaphysalis longicornis]|uniref:Mesoderm induction early response protein 1 n=1 Tax=Haemaphysalis longicornis TaxID=44386 RepID=A0A9J6FX20_HAELO|nr:hypothetical protein HPB48_010916 [Haemaphysalis longicornis]